MPLYGQGWQPQQIKRFVRNFNSSMGTALVDTELGLGYIKGLGNPEGPHALACELVGSSLAEWLGASTLDFSLIDVLGSDEIPLPSGAKLTPGAAFISRAESTAVPWGKDPATLNKVVPRTAITDLVILDTWTRNCDRHAPDGLRVNLDNVLLIQSRESKRDIELLSMDFTHAFTCGQELSRQIAFIDRVKDTKIYGRFPEFTPCLDREHVKLRAIQLATFTTQMATEIVNRIPQEWQVSTEIRSALARRE